MKIGDIVICIDDSIKVDNLKSAFKWFQMWVKKDTKYTIREILSNDEIVVGVLLEEVVNFPIFQPLLDRVQEPAFAIWRFRELEKSSNSEKNSNIEKLEKNNLLLLN